MGRVEERMGLLPLRFLAPGTCSLRKLESLITREVAYRRAEGKELEFVVVDQLSFVTATDPDGREVDDDRKRMNIISRALKALGERLNVAIIALAQLNRGLEARADKRPMASDLKESGRLEEDAAIILFVYREEYYLAQTRPKPGEKDPKGVRDLMEEWEADMGAVRGKVDLICPKNRHDATRTKTAKFVGKFVQSEAATRTSSMKNTTRRCSSKGRQMKPKHEGACLGDGRQGPVGGSLEVECRARAPRQRHQFRSVAQPQDDGR